MRTLEEIRKTPVGLLTDAEINLLDADGQEFSRKVKANLLRQRTCLDHEKVGTGSHLDSRCGWHPGYCKHCGTDMSQDSGD